MQSYNEQLPTAEPPITAVTRPPVEAINTEVISLNFTITNLDYNPAMFNSTANDIIVLVDNAFKSSAFSSKYKNCHVDSIGTVSSGTKVNTICTIEKDTTGTPFDKVAFYNEIESVTKNVTIWGKYTLDKNSLYVNGYNKVNTATTAEPPVTAVTRPPVEAINTEDITLNFTITNLDYNPAMFNSTANDIIVLVDNAIKSSAFSSKYKNCHVDSIGTVSSGTKVNTICTIEKDTTGTPFDKVAFYNEIESVTENVTIWGKYTLDKNSLYVNGYNKVNTATTAEPPVTAVTRPPVEAINTEDITLNFTITNLDYNPAMFNSTANDIIVLVDNAIKSSAFSSKYKNCHVDSIGTVSSGTKVNTICTIEKDTTGTPFDKVAFYNEIESVTKNVTIWGKYTLDKNSLYVNGYNKVNTATTAEPPVTAVTRPPVEAINTEDITLNFTITNLDYNPAMFNSTANDIIVLVDNAIKSSSFSSKYKNCHVDSIGTVSSGTKVNTVCTIEKDTTGTPFDKVAFYNEIESVTKNVTIWGKYTLDKNSLYVNGYNKVNTATTAEPPVTAVTRPPVEAINTEDITLNFTITNLDYNPAMFNSTANDIIVLVDNAIKSSAFSSKYKNCHVDSIGTVSSGTKVNTICTIEKDTTGTPFDKVAFYNEIESVTKNVTIWGKYTLDKNSLYVNGYNKVNTATTAEPPVTAVTRPPVEAINTEDITLNFTITNLDYNPAMFNSTANDIIVLVDNAIKSSAFSSKYKNCHVDSIGTVSSGTKVNTICTIEKDTTGTPFDKVAFYNEIESVTKNVTIWGKYTLDKNSLYVNGYNKVNTATTAEPPVTAVTRPPVEAINTEDITLNFTITNLDYNPAMFNSTANDIIVLVDNAIKSSAFSSKYKNCHVDSIGTVSSGTKVNTICTIEKDTTGTPFDKVAFYNEIESVTKNVTIWGKYTLDKNSLYVNGYNKVSTATTPKPTTTTTPTTTNAPSPTFALRQFLLNFTITNLNHSSDLDNNNSTNFNMNKNNLDKLLNAVFKNSILNPSFLNCSVSGFRATPKTPFTTAESVCIFNVTILAKVYLEDDIYGVFINMTTDGTSLGNYTLVKESIQVTYKNTEEITSTTKATSTITATSITTTTSTTTTMTTTTTTATIENVPAPGDLGFYINYTITNKFVPSDPEEYEKMKLSIEEEMNKLYKNSALAKKFKFCKLASMRNGSIIASCNCYFEDDPIVNKESVEKEFYNLTATGSLLGQDFQLKNIAIAEIPKSNDLPFWAIILICLAVLLGLVIIFLVIFLLLFCLKRRRGVYDIPENLYGIYFPHMDMRKLY
ncbi:mucin-16 [Rhinophrynus dorsalis]